jgi:carbon storage regulator
MLVLSRKLGETLVIDGNITVKVIQVQGNAVRLGIEAPQQVPVHRAEIHERLEKAARGLKPCGV